MRKRTVFGSVVGIVGGVAFVHYGGPDLTAAAIVGALLGVVVYVSFRW